MIRGLGLIDEIKWEGIDSLTVHLIYVALDSNNPHDPELYGGFDIPNISTTIDSAQFNSTLITAFKNKLIADHSIVFGELDTVRVMSSALDG